MCLCELWVEERERASSSPEESKREQRSKNFLSISGVHHTHTKCDDKIVDLYMSMGRVKDQYIGPVVKMVRKGSNSGESVSVIN